ncbi:hypothetical protein QBD00_004301 [Ochrobactrum sp. AN78]|nr:hypothetical protein [Ochrobactrum sp. AN78]
MDGPRRLKETDILRQSESSNGHNGKSFNAHIDFNETRFSTLAASSLRSL